TSVKNAMESTNAAAALVAACSLPPAAMLPDLSSAICTAAAREWIRSPPQLAYTIAGLAADRMVMLTACLPYTPAGNTDSGDTLSQKPLPLESVTDQAGLKIVSLRSMRNVSFEGPPQ